jgi:asparagine synthase (glutamine-hydrolysing)
MKISDYEEIFREIFTEAVHCRLRSSFPIGSNLSGGLDSASIVCMAAGGKYFDIPWKLQTFSGVFNIVRNCDEREYFQRVVQRYELQSHTLPVDSINPAITFDKLISSEDEPLWAPHIFMRANLLSMTRDNGVRVLLDGYDGDSAVSYGYNLVSELALSVNLKKLVQCYSYSCRNSKYQIFKKIFLLYLNIVKEKMPVSCIFSSKRKYISDKLNMLDPEFANITNMKERLAQHLSSMPRLGQDEKTYHLKRISQPFHPQGVEFLERISAKEKISVRFPFFDKRVIEFCLNLPAEEKYYQGKNRSIVRKALADLLPDEIRERKEKSDFSASLLHAFAKNDDGWLTSNIGSISKTSYCYHNKKYFQKSLVTYNWSKSSREKYRSLLYILSLVVLYRWLDHNANRLITSK